MVNPRKPRTFTQWMMYLCPVVIALYVALLPELENLRNPQIPGALNFSSPRPALERYVARSEASSPQDHQKGGSMDWVYDRYDDLMAWERNPWKSKKTVFGSHFLDLMESGKPRDRALAKELRRLGVRLHQQALERYPELALPDKIVPPERNGFLKWLELTERSPPRGMFSDLPEQLERHRTGGPWDSEAARSWLAKEKALLDEVRSIGLMPEHSISGIDIGRWRMMYARPVIRSAEALLWEARLAVEDGNLSGALESVRAARGLARQLETTSLIAATVQILAEMQVQGYTLSEILPAVPAEQFDPTA